MGKCSQGAGGAAADASTPEGDPLTKVVLARRTDVLFRGELDPLALLAALQVGRRYAASTRLVAAMAHDCAVHPRQRRRTASSCAVACLRRSGLRGTVHMA
jgi:hypothetical protein